jgi:hypothetical protein
MKVFFKWLRKKLENINELEKDFMVIAPTSSSHLDSHGMNFTVYRANGGHIIEHRVYDRKTDRNNNSLHIITDDKDLGDELGKIITFENLRS